ncbi:hypothetical protein C8R43DRAFT_945872 [Mycena crocata]|nr:hypothetical protein C8R43DRAFT_945872 [Mycena crocata]
MSSQKRIAPNELCAPPTAKKRKTDRPSSPTDSTIANSNRFSMKLSDNEILDLLLFLTGCVAAMGIHSKEAAPLITYTNHVRNTHNWKMTQAFAAATGQELAVYYSEDAVGRKKLKQ